jgi:peptidyl-prolyl cis-trans isomerase A (cyclophilin A)
VKGHAVKLISRLGLLALFLMLFVGCVPASLWAQAPDSKTDSKPAAQTAKPKSTAAAHSGTDPALLHPATLKAQAPAEYDVNFVTTKGDFVIHVTRAWAPQGADRFYNLVKHHFYDGAAFFRFVDGFVVQFGLSGNPAVNKAWTAANIKDDPVKSSNKPGFITFAMAGPNTRTTQVFINLGDNSRLDGMGFAPFGQVTSGMDVVKSFYSGYADAPTNHQGEITNEGKAYLDKNFPKLDSIKTATIVGPAGAADAAPAHKASATGAAKSQ